jgi:hypothetical protein
LFTDARQSGGVDREQRPNAEEAEHETDRAADD